ncbi:MAG: family 1 encapsulin nanocompartment shell protein [Planctomycetota bacterium]
MTDLLRRSHAPLTDAAWREIDETAARLLKTHLVAREIVDVEGPFGWEFAAVNLGGLDIADEAGPEDVPWGTRRVMPLIEARLPFMLNQMELDAVSRGAKDADLEPLETVAKQACAFEETAIYHGMPSARLVGLLQEAGRGKVALPKQPREMVQAVAEAVRKLQQAGVPRPYFLLLGTEPLLRLQTDGDGGYPPYRVIQELVEGHIRSCPTLQGGLLLSGAPGNFELTIGQDWSIGYTMHDRDTIELYLTESFMFRVLEPAAAVELTGKTAAT